MKHGDRTHFGPTPDVRSQEPPASQSTKTDRGLAPRGERKGLIRAMGHGSQSFYSNTTSQASQTSPLSVHVSQRSHPVASASVAPWLWGPPGQALARRSVHPTRPGQRQLEPAGGHPKKLGHNNTQNLLWIYYNYRIHSTKLSCSLWDSKLHHKATKLCCRLLIAVLAPASRRSRRPIPPPNSATASWWASVGAGRRRGTPWCSG